MGMMSDLARRFRQINLLISPPPQLRRQHERFQVSCDIEIETESGEVSTCRTIDISNGGVFVKPPLPAAEGERIQISVGMLLRRVEGEVVAHRGNGTAIRFYSPAHGAALTTWLLDQQRKRTVN